jgi:hypothetical protein
LVEEKAVVGPNLFLIVLNKNVEYVELGRSDGKHVTEEDPW